MPFNIYKGNASEFTISLMSILGFYLLPASVLFLILAGIGVFLPRNLHQRYVSIIFIIGVLIWLQGNILVWDYGVLGKGDIDWNKNAWRGWVDGTLWIGLMGLACFFHKRAYKLTTPVCTLLLCSQLIYLGYLSFQKPEMWKNKKEISLNLSPSSEIFKFSLRQNVIQVVLDELQSTIFEEIINADPDHYHKILEGFTFFKETTGSFPTTIMSIPAIMSGRIYKNDIPIHKFIGETIGGETISNALHDNGYAVDFAASFGWWYAKGRYSNAYYIPVPYGVTREEYVGGNSLWMLDLVLLRYSPHFLKETKHKMPLFRSIMNLDKEDSRSFEALRHFAHKAFLKDLIENMSASRDKPVYKLIHLTTTHYPAVLNKNCEYSGKVLPWTWENIRIQAKCSFDDFLGFLNRLKSIGIYNSSLIIIHSDHGYWKIANSAKQLKLKNSNEKINRDFRDEEHLAQVACSSLALMAIKPPFSKGPLKISTAHTMIKEIPDTVSSILNLPQKFGGRSAFEVDTKKSRERRFHYYERLNRPNDKYFGKMSEYIILGSAFDRDSWRLTATHYALPSDSSYLTNSIDFGTRQASRFLRSGWGGNESHKGGHSFNWALGESASVFLSLPVGQVNLSAKMKTPRFHKPQQVTIKVDGNVIGSWKLPPSFRSWENRNIVIKADKNRPKNSVVEFLFSQYRKPDKKDNRPLAVLFESITLSKAINANQ